MNNKKNNDYIGTLNDLRISEYCQKDILISKNFISDNIKQACYELTAGGIYYDLAQAGVRIDLHTDNFNYILIKPKQSVVIITKEELNIPPNIIGRILTKGKLFSIGLHPVNTYADPGFKGNIGIIFTNNSTNYLKIKEDDAIAKIEFSVLQEAVAIPYSGQHGYLTKIWPLAVEYKLTDAEFESDSRIKDVSEEINQIYGTRYSNVIKSLLSVEKKLLIASIAYFTFSLLIIGILIKTDKMDWFSPFSAIILGLLANAVSGFFMYKLGRSKLIK